MNTASKRAIDFLKGWPNPSLLPPKLLQAAAANVLLDSPQITTPVLEYGEDEGYLPLRKSIAQWLTKFYTPQDAISHERIVISGGASQNLACILQVFSDPIYTRNIWIVAPAYYLAFRIFNDSGFEGRLKAVPEDEEGIDIDFLRKKIQQSEQHAIEQGNNEPGNVYDMLQWNSSAETPPSVMDKAFLPRLVDVDRTLDGGPIDNFGNAVSNGSFSKIVGPGCRTGWAEGTENLAYGISQAGSSRSGGAPSQLAASFINDMLTSGTLEHHIYNYLQPIYTRRYHRLLSAVEKYLLPLGLSMPQADKDVAGGYFLWLTLPGSLKAEEVWKTAQEEENVKIITGAKFRVEGDEDNPATTFERDFRLCYAWVDEELLEEGVIRLARVIQHLRVSGR